MVRRTSPRDRHSADATAPPVRAPAVITSSAPLPLVGREQGALPGCHDQILSELAAVAAGLTGHFDTWFWLRYADTTHGPHIRARFHGHPAALGGHLLPALPGPARSAWAVEAVAAAAGAVAARFCVGAVAAWKVAAAVSDDARAAPARRVPTVRSDG